MLRQASLLASFPSVGIQARFLTYNRVIYAGEFLATK